MNVKIGELVEYVEGLNNASRRRANRMHGTINDLLAIKKELEEQADGDAQVIKTLELQVKAANEVALQASADTRKEIGEKLKQHYGFSLEGLKEVGAL